MTALRTEVDSLRGLSGAARKRRAAENDRGNFEFDTRVLTRTQLEAARATAWKQMGEPILTLDAARDWINERGLVLFTPRGSQPAGTGGLR